MLKKLRIERGLRQMDIADAIGVARGTMSMYESGQRTPNFETAEAIADVLNVPLSFLIESPIQHPSIPSNAVSENFCRVEAVSVPVLDNTGNGMMAFTHQVLAAPEANLRGHYDFALTMTDDSMIGSRIITGDLVLIRAQMECNDGEMAAIMLDGSAVLRRVYQTPEGVILAADNSKYPPISISHANMSRMNIVGKAVAFRSTI